MIGKKRDLGHDADTEASRDSCLDAEETGACVGDVPGATGRLERMDRPVAVEAPLLEHRERQRIAAKIDPVAAAADSMQTLGPSGDGARLTHIALEQCEVEFTAFEFAAQIDTQSATHV